MDTKLQKPHTSDVVKSNAQRGNALGTIFGLEAGDVRLPYVYLIRANTKNARLADGKRPPVNTLFHSLKKESYEYLDVLIAHATKGTSPQRRLDEDGDEMTDAEGNALIDNKTCFRALILPVDNPAQPFVTTFKGWNLFTSWREFVSLLASTGRTNLDVVVRMTSKEQENKRGFTQVFDMQILREATAEERETMLKASNSLGSVTARAVDGEDEADDAITTEATSVDEILKDDTNVDLTGTLEGNETLDEILKEGNHS